MAMALALPGTPNAQHLDYLKMYYLISLQRGLIRHRLGDMTFTRAGFADNQCIGPIANKL